MDVTELLHESEGENEAEADSPNSNWDTYYDETENDDLYDKLFSSDDSDSSNFICIMHTGNNVNLLV